jgi:beta-lactam-binding protein with PASTA domain
MLALGLVVLTAVAGCGSESKDTAVPEVVPLYVQDAVAKLERAGLRASILSAPEITEASLGINGYAVATQDPQPGVLVSRGSAVRLTLNPSVNGGPGGVGPAGHVPDLVGLDVNRALGLAGAQGLLVTVRPLDHEVERLVVTEQSLPPGEDVDRGSVITLALG